MALSVVWESQTIPVQIIYSDRRRSWAIEVKTTGEVIIRVPSSVPEQKVMEIAQSRAKWIAKQREKFQGHAAKPRRYENGETMPFFGNELIVARKTGPARADIAGDRLCLSVPDSFAPEEAEKLVRDMVMLLYRRAGPAVLDSCVEKYAGLAGVPKPLLRMRLQERKWGCCTLKNGIIINAKVLLAPKSVAEYLVVHEIAHIRFRHHQKTYWDEVGRLMPEYREAEHLLKEDGWKWTF